MKSFLLVYDRQSGKLLDQQEYCPGDRAKALADRAARELALRGRPNVEVVVLYAESLDALKRTHSRYFKTLAELRKAPVR